MRPSENIRQKLVHRIPECGASDRRPKSHQHIPRTLVARRVVGRRQRSRSQVPAQQGKIRRPMTCIRPRHQRPRHRIQHPPAKRFARSKHVIPRILPENHCQGSSRKHSLRCAPKRSRPQPLTERPAIGPILRPAIDRLTIPGRDQVAYQTVRRNRVPQGPHHLVASALPRCRLPSPHNHVGRANNMSRSRPDLGIRPRFPIRCIRHILRCHSRSHRRGDQDLRRGLCPQQRSSPYPKQESHRHPRQTARTGNGHQAKP